MLVGLLWGTWNPVAQLCFSIAATAYAVALGLRGWKPWRMAMYSSFADGDSARWNRNPTAVAVGEYLQTSRVRWTAAALTGTAALTP